MIDFPDAVGAQPGKRVGGALRSSGSRRRTELGNQVSQPRLGLAPAERARPGVVQSAQGEQHKERLVRHSFAVVLILLERGKPLQDLFVRQLGSVVTFPMVSLVDASWSPATSDSVDIAGGFAGQSTSSAGRPATGEHDRSCGWAEFPADLAL